MKVRVRNPEHARQHVWFFTQPEFFDYEGEEIQVKWVKPHELALTTGMPDFPFRVIQRKNIISIDDREVTAPAEIKEITRVVQGSRGDQYVVTNQGGRWSCTCPGFTFRRSCKHTTLVQEEK